MIAKVRLNVGDGADWDLSIPVDSRFDELLLAIAQTISQVTQEPVEVLVKHEHPETKSKFFVSPK